MGVRKQLDYRKHHTGVKMDAIKKKMQAMKVEKDNACDRCDVCEEASKVAKVRAAKAEDEVAELAAKARQLETELDLCTEKLGIVTLQLEEKEKSLMAAEAEMNALNRRVSGLEEDLEKTEEKLQQANTKLDKAGAAADDSERAKKVFENKATDDDRESPNWRRNSRMLETRPRLLMLHMRRLPRSSPPVSLILRRLRREPIPERQRSLNSKRS